VTPQACRSGGPDDPARVLNTHRAVSHEPQETGAAIIGAFQRMAGNRAVVSLLGRPLRSPLLLPSAGSAAPVAQREAWSAPMPVAQRDGPAGEVKDASGTKVEPGPILSGSGSTFTLPTSVTLVKPPARGRGGWLTAPSFSLKLDPAGMVAGMLDQVTLGGFQLTNPTLVFDAGSNSVTGVGTVSIPTMYPGVDSPTLIQVRVRSSGLGLFEAEATTGPFVAELTVDLAYDSEPLRRVIDAAGPATSPERLQAPRNWTVMRA
jgi:hypothetical protein